MTVSNPSHEVTITIISKDDDPSVNIKVTWNPLMNDDDVEKLGYTPTAYSVAENILFHIEELVNQASLLEIEEEDLSENRTIN